MDKDSVKMTGADDGSEHETNKESDWSTEKESTGSRAKPSRENEHDGVTEEEMTSPRPLEELAGYRDVLGNLADLVERENLQLKAVHFKDFERWPDLDDVMTQAYNVSQEYHRTMTQVTWAMSRLRQQLVNLRNTMDSKLTDEGLYSWIQGPLAHPSDREQTASQARLLAKAAEARAHAGRTKAEVTKVEEQISHLEADAADTASEAQKAASEAEYAKQAAEEARLAAIAKEKGEEEENMRAEEERRKKEQEEQEQRDMEERMKQERARLKSSPDFQEEQRLMAAMRNPKNWPKFVYSTDPGSINIPVGCVVRAMPNSITSDMIEVKSLSQLDEHVTLEDGEELVSHIVRLAPTDPSGIFDSGEEPLAIALPHCARRNIFRAPVVKAKAMDGTWKPLPTSEVIIDDIREYKFVEVRLRHLCALTVVTRSKEEELTLTRRGTKLVTSVDGRINMIIKPNTVRFSTPVQCKVQPLDLPLVNDLKQRHREECQQLMASSPLLTLNLGVSSELMKNVQLTLPLPPPPAKVKRPGTATNPRHGRKRHSIARPKSAFFSVPRLTNEDKGDTVHLAVRTNQNGWIMMEEPNVVQSKTKDFAQFDIFLDKPCTKMMVLRTQLGAATEPIPFIATSLERALTERIVHILLRQDAHDPQNVVIQCVDTNKLDRYVECLADDGYEYGPQPSSRLTVREGQQMFARFRGNIQPESVDQELRFVFNSQIKNRLELRVCEIDRFAQKGIDCYRGFVQVYTYGMVEQDVPVDPHKDLAEAKKKNLPLKKIMVHGEVLMAELLIQLPKPDREPSRPVSRATPELKIEGPVSNDLFRYLASNLGEEWRKLAKYLNVGRIRIQAIMRQNVNNDQDSVIYDMLITWAKRVPRSLDKVDVMCRALSRCGRYDLAEEIRDKENDVILRKNDMNKDSLLQKAFQKVVHNSQVVSEWKFLASELGLEESEISDVEENYTGRECCLQSLLLWKQRYNEEATVRTLSLHLRRCHWPNVAELIRG